MPVVDGPPDPNAAEQDCPVCSTEGGYVRHGTDSVCAYCGHVRGARSPQVDADTPWRDWHSHRRSNEDYEGWTGENRIRFVGGFSSAYIFEDDF